MGSHAELLARVDSFRRAADAGDGERTRRAVAELIDAYLEHMDAERPLLLRLPRFRARLVGRGQERLLADLVQLLLEAEGSGATCRCAEVGAEVGAELVLQIEAEQRAFAGVVRSRDD